MTDLSTANLKRLLAESSPGPWKFHEEEEWEHVAGPEYPAMLTAIEHAVNGSDGKYLFGNFNDTVLEERPGNLTLAAAAPDLAQEVLRMREELNSMKRAWLFMTIEPHLSGLERTLATQALNSIDEVLGDHDG